MIRLAAPSDARQLKDLWQEVFQEDEEYLRAFFQCLFRPENALVQEEDGRIVSALHMVPYDFRDGDEVHPMLYLYAIATLQGYRSRGLGRALTEAAFPIARERGFSGVFLVPAEESLFQWYRKMGFFVELERSVVRLDPAEIRCRISNGGDPPFHRPMKEGEWWRLYREGPFHRGGWIALDRAQNDFFLRVLLREGGSAWMMEIDGRPHYALLRAEADRVLVYETSARPIDLPELLAFLSHRFAEKEICFHQPLCFSPEELQRGSRLFGLLHPLKKTAVPRINRVLL